MTASPSPTTTTASTSISSSSGTAVVPFWIHSTFRHRGRQVKPYGLEWGLDGDSIMTFVPATHLVDDPTTIVKQTATTITTTAVKEEEKDCDLESFSTRRGLVEAYNRWAYSKQLEFKTVDDIEEVTRHNKTDGNHLTVELKTIPSINVVPFQYNTPQNVEEWIREKLVGEPQTTSTTNKESIVEVWVNGVHAGNLNGEMSLSPILLAIKMAQHGPGTTWCVKRQWKSTEQGGGGLIRIEKYFRGMLRQQQQLFEHIMDNLIAMEDPELLDSNTLIGTATLPDWIMGGNLTSRLHIEELENGDIKFVRPLYDDDIATADRRFVLSKRRNPDQAAMVQKELKRLRRIAAFRHPFIAKARVREVDENEKQEESHQVSFDFGEKDGNDSPYGRRYRDDTSVSSSLVVENPSASDED